MTPFQTVTTATSIADVAVSRYASATDNRGSITTLDAVANEMRNNTLLRKSTGKIRAEYALHGKTPAYDSLKRRMPAVIFAGTFSPTRRGVENWSRPSGLICADVDDVTPDQGTALLVSLRQHGAVALAINSFREGGVELVSALTPAPQTEYEHRHAFFAVQQWAAEEWDVALDGSCVDPQRLCFLASNDVELKQPTLALDWPAVELPTPTMIAIEQAKADVDARITTEKAANQTRRAKIPSQQRAPVQGYVTLGPMASALLDAQLQYLSQSLGACDGARDCLAVMIALCGIQSGERRYLDFAWWHDSAAARARFRAARPQDPNPLATISVIARRYGFDQRAFYQTITPAAPHRRLR